VKNKAILLQKNVSQGWLPQCWVCRIAEKWPLFEHLDLLLWTTTDPASFGGGVHMGVGSVFFELNIKHTAITTFLKCSQLTRYSCRSSIRFPWLPFIPKPMCMQRRNTWHNTF